MKPCVRRFKNTYSCVGQLETFFDPSEHGTVVQRPLLTHLKIRTPSVTYPRVPSSTISYKDYLLSSLLSPSLEPI